MLPPAPPAFSVTIGWPSAPRIRSAMMRAAASVDPPGGNGTIKVSGRDGNGCACASALQLTISNSAATSLLITSSPNAHLLRLVYFSRALQRLFQLLQ